MKLKDGKPIIFPRFCCIATMIMLCLAASPDVVYSQLQKPAYSVGASFHYGFIMAHRGSIVELQKDHVKTAEIFFQKQTTGNHHWHQIYHFPLMGVKYQLFNLGNPGQTGFVHSVVPYLDFDFLKNNNIAFHLSFGVGTAYFTRKFLVHENYKNLAIGTRLTFAISLTTELNWRINKHFSFITGLAFDHFSNGAVKTPNLGLNIPTVKAGIAYQGGLTELRKTELSELNRKWRKSICLSGGIKQRYPVNGPYYGVASLSFTAVKPVSRKSGFGAGFDLHYDASFREIFKNSDGDKAPLQDAVRAGVNGSYELMFSDFSILLQCGYYLYTQYMSEGKVYQRLGMRYEFIPGWFSCLNLRSHFGKADFFELGLGIRF
ncbi:MAG: acyloxyacyl hydrolase [Bacteroidia bacterium]|nr:acyloxyacyl hydrolase [Bacteroidia bacterium]MCZ2276344.1 acyloxyacyl hydrolase [Bacteroidia bacterium]